MVWTQIRVSHVRAILANRRQGVEIDLPPMTGFQQPKELYKVSS